MFTDHNLFKVTILFVMMAALTACGSETAKKSAGNSKENSKQSSSDTDDSNDSEKASVCDFGEEKDVLGFYTAVVGDSGETDTDVQMYLTYDCYYDRYHATITRSAFSFTCVGGFSYADGYLTISAEDVADAGKTYDLVFYTTSDRSLVFDDTKSVSLDEIPEEVLVLDDETKSDFVLANKEQYTIEDVVGNGDDYEVFPAEEAVVTDDIIGDYSAIADTEGEEVVPAITITKEDDGYSFVLKTTKETAGTASYNDGMLVLAFEDVDNNVNITRLRHLCFYTDSEGRLNLDTTQSSDLMFVDLGIPMQYFVNELVFTK